MEVLEHRVSAITGELVEVIITPQIWHGIPRGKDYLKEGSGLESSDQFKLSVHGKAGHGTWPHMCIDPLPIAAELRLALQNIISRVVDPLLPACVTIGRMEYGIKSGRLPQEGYAQAAPLLALEGILRGRGLILCFQRRHIPYESGVDDEIQAL